MKAQAFNLIRQAQGIRMSWLMLLTTIAYCITKAMKEMVLLGQPELGAAYLPVVNFFVALPCSFFLGGFYIRLQYRHSTRFAYHILCVLLLSYMTAYTFWFSSNIPGIGSNAHWLLHTVLPASVVKPIAILAGSWPAVCYYTACELWGNFTLMVLFWQLANEAYTTHQARSLYPWFVTISSFGMICSSFVMDWIHQTTDPVYTSFVYTILLATCMNGLVWSSLSPQTSHIHKPSTRTSLHWLSMFRLCANSSAILCLAASIVLYYTLSNILEVTLKEQVVNSLQNPVDYLSFMRDNLFYQGSAIMIMGLARQFVFPGLSWSVTAGLTPTICIAVVNGFLLYSMNLMPFSLGHFDPQSTIYFGLFAVIVLKTLKYAFFDVAKEMFYIPLDADVRSQGKTVVDGMGARIGKSGYGVLQFLLFSCTGHYNMIALMPYLLSMVLILSCLWAWVAVYLDQLYHSHEDDIYSPDPA